jgi:hypothetical protein
MESKAVTHIKTWLPWLTFGTALVVIADVSTRRGRSAALRDSESRAQVRSKNGELSCRLPHHERTVEPELELDLEGVFDGAART